MGLGRLATTQAATAGRLAKQKGRPAVGMQIGSVALGNDAALAYVTCCTAMPRP